MSVIYINSELIIHAHGTFKSLSQTNQFNDSCLKLLIYGPIILKSNRTEQMKIAIKLWPEGVNFAAMMADLFFLSLFCIALLKKYHYFIATNICHNWCTYFHWACSYLWFLRPISPNWAYLTGCSNNLLQP